MKGAGNTKNEIDTDRKTADLWTYKISDIRGESGSNISLFEGRRGSTSDDLLSQNASRSNRARDTERVGTNSCTERWIDEIVKKLREMYGWDAKKSQAKPNTDTMLSDRDTIENMDMSNGVKYKHKV